MVVGNCLVVFVCAVYCVGGWVSYLLVGYEMVCFDVNVVEDQFLVCGVLCLLVVEDFLI